VQELLAAAAHLSTSKASSGMDTHWSYVSTLLLLLLKRAEVLKMIKSQAKVLQRSSGMDQVGWQQLQPLQLRLPSITSWQ
jgi:hypothetical protein